MPRRSFCGEAAMPGKRIQFDDATLYALNELARNTMKDFQELADEAFDDLLKKHKVPRTLHEALRRSAREIPANENRGKARRK
jgi:hypothetical protein